LPAPGSMTRLAILTSHPVQYYAPLFRRLAKVLDVTVLFAHRATPREQARAGFGEAFDWDVDLTHGYRHVSLANVARRPGTDHFLGCDTPEIGERLREGRFDALLTMGWHLKSYAQGVFAAKRLDLPVMTRGDSHLDTPRSVLRRLGKALIYPAGLRLFDAALYVGARNRAYYQHYHYPVDRLFFSPHCVDNDWFSARATQEARVALREERRIGDDAFVVLFAGKLLPFKRPLDVVRAAAKCRSDGCAVEVVVAGSGALEEQLVGEARRLAVPLHPLGFRNQTQMPAAYAAADCLVLPSDGRETWGLVANEALACGRPVVVSQACGCAPDLTAAGAAGRAFPTGDVDALARCLVSFMRAPPSRQAMAEVAQRYSLDRAAAGICEALGRVTCGRISLR
jgi:glycosyltransferase involved in cell wall biosynthesis